MGERRQQKQKQQQLSDVKRVFDEWAELGRGDSMALSHEPFTRHAFELLNLSADSHYLDIGCGNGYSVRWAAERCPEGHALGIDVSSSMISKAVELSGEWANASFRQAVFPDQTIPDESFDAILSMEVFYYLPDLAAGITEVTRLLRPGGRFACIVDFYGENIASHSWPADLGVDMTLLDEARWREALETAGLEVVTQERIKLDPDKASEPWKAEQGSLLTLGRKRPT